MFQSEIKLHRPKSPPYILSLEKLRHQRVVAIKINLPLVPLQRIAHPQRRLIASKSEISHISSHLQRKNSSDLTVEASHHAGLQTRLVLNMRLARCR